MHKCIMVKVGGKRKTHKVCKKHVNFTEVWGKIIIFLKWGKCTKTAKIGGKFFTESEKFVGNMGEMQNREEMHHCLRGMNAPGATP